jgi:hypothetical protein
VLAAGVMMLLLGASSARAALSNDGTVTVEYSGNFTQSFIDQPSDPAVGQGSMHFHWDEKATFALSGRSENSPTAKLVTASLTVGGGSSHTYAPPNARYSCSGTFSLRPRAPMTIFLDYGLSEVDIHALLPSTGSYVQSSAPATSNCAVPKSGGIGFATPADAAQAFAAAEDPLVTVRVPSNPYSKRFTANGSDAQVTQSFSALLEVTTNGKTTGPNRIKLTPAEIQSKLNAFNALKQTTPAALYPCIAGAAGTALLGGGIPGIVIGGTLISVAGAECRDYYNTVMAELNTVKDPPRSDVGVLADAGQDVRPRLAAASCSGRTGAVLRTCQQAALASAQLLAAARATASAAQAIAITIAREVGAQRAHKTSAAARQNGQLIALGKVFASRRRGEIAAGAALAALFRKAGASLRLTPSVYRQAETVLLGDLASHGVSAAHRAYAERFLHPGTLNVLRTLGH